MNKTSVTDDMISRYLSGNSNEEEQRTLLAWINESPANEKQLFILKDIYDAAAMTQLFEEAKTQENWELIQKRLTNRQPSISSKPTTSRPKFTHWMMVAVRYAAVLLIGISGTAAAFYFFSREMHPQNQPVLTYHVTTDKGDKATVALPDGSLVKLNACSSLSYQSNYGKNDRNVDFTGEAFFDIQTNPDIPFTVKTYGLNINAYGTTFNVKAYPEDDMVETTLVNGKVSINNQHDQPIITLEPNQVISIPKLLVLSGQNNNQTAMTLNDQIPVKVEKTDVPKNTIRKEPVLRKNVKTEEYTSWKDDKWIIKSESLESLAKKIERRYDVSVLIEDEASKKYVFSGTLRNYPLEQVLDIIRLNAPIQYSVKEKSVIIREEKQMKKQYQKLINSQ